MTYGQYEGFGKEILQLDDENIKLRKLLAINASLFHLHCTSVQRTRLDNPELGDLVYEMTTTHSTDMRRIAMGIGLLSIVRTEPVAIDIEGDNIEFGEETATYIQYGPEVDDLCRWTNSKFYVIPTDMSFGSLRLPT